jgi:uncharacterized protein DUF4136
MEERMIGTPKTQRHTRTTLRVASLVVGAAGLLTAAACGDDGDTNLVVTPLPANIVTTFKDSTFNFTVLHTFAMPDTVVHFVPLTGTPVPVSRDFDATIIQRVRQDFLARGYTEVTPSASLTPDFVVLIGATGTDNFDAFVSSNWFTIWGFSPIWAFQPAFNNSWILVYPWFPVVGTTAYERGTLIVTLIPTLTVNPLAQSIQAEWAGVATGALGLQSNASITAAIDEMFRQSPYLTATNP